MKKIVYAISGTIEVPDGVNVDDLLVKLSTLCDKTFEGVEIDIDECDWVDEYDDDED